MKTPREQRDLKGLVQAVETRTSEYVKIDNELVEQPWLMERIEFDPEGRLAALESRSFKHPSKIRATYRYSGAGPQRERQELVDGELRGREVSYFDSQGRLVERSNFSADGKLLEKRVISYDESGKKTEEVFSPHPNSGFREGSDTSISFNVDVVGLEDRGFGARSIRTVRTLYNSRGYAEEVQALDKDGEVLVRVAIRTDLQGRAIHWRHSLNLLKAIPELRGIRAEAETEDLRRALTGEEELAFETEISYDSQGRKVQETSHDGSSLREQRLIRYEPNGDEYEERYYPDGRIHRARIRVQLDSHGNWTEKLIGSWNEERQDWDANVVYRRIISYYR
ncbi:MAG: hypothetical protein ACR2L2_12365 [Acidobacteriota bacterium]